MKPKQYDAKWECKVDIFNIVRISMYSKTLCFFVFVALRPKSTAKVIAGRSVHLTTLFPGQA